MSFTEHELSVARQAIKLNSEILYTMSRAVQALANTARKDSPRSAEIDADLRQTMARASAVMTKNPAECLLILQRAEAHFREVAEREAAARRAEAEKRYQMAVERNLSAHNIAARPAGYPAWAKEAIPPVKAAIAVAYTALDQASIRVSHVETDVSLRELLTEIAGPARALVEMIDVEFRKSIDRQSGERLSEAA